MTEKKRFKLHIKWHNIEKTEGEATLTDNGQPLIETEQITDARLLKNILNDLYNENEQLKQEISQLRHWNKCLAEKRHQEISYRPYTASKSDKELQEFLEQKVFNCSDR